MRRLVPSLLLSIAIAGCGAAAPTTPPTPAPSASAPDVKLTALQQIQRDAKKLDPLVTAPSVKSFLAATSRLPVITPRRLFKDTKDTTRQARFYTEAEAAKLPDAERATLKEIPADEELYYNTKYGSPLSYARPLDLLASRGVVLSKGMKLLDFGYGYIGHLRLLATLGLDTTGVDVDPMLTALYSSPGDQGAMEGEGGLKGTVRLLNGELFKDAALRAQVGAGYDVVISKNVLKRGYIHPDRPAKKEQLIDLGAPDDVVLKGFFDALKPGGSLLIYNICPALTPPDKPFVPWSDGRSPFSKKQFEDAGFTVVAMDQDDTDSVRKMGKALGWDADPDDKWDLDHDLSVLWTLVKR
jgi:hypothetical protein